MVQSSHILLLVLTCLLVVGGDIVEDAVGSVKDTYDTAKDAVKDLSRTQETGNVMCQKCRIEKSLDNNIISISDLVTETVEASGRCQGYECTNGEDWCLVTYYRRRAFDDDPERKFEVHSCGSETIKKADNVCRDILNGDDHNIVEDCHTKRSDASSVYKIYLSIATSILFLYLGQ